MADAAISLPKWAFPNLQTSIGVRADREVVLAAVKRNGLDLQYASDSLRADREVVLAAVEQTGLALQYASESLLGDKSVVSAAMQRSAALLRRKTFPFPVRTNMFFRNNEEECFGFLARDIALYTNKVVMLEAVQACGWALQFAGDSLRADRDIVLEAIKQDGTALCCANVMFRADREVVMEAVKQHGGALEYAGHFRQDREVALAAIRQRGEALRFASDALRSDVEVVLEAVKQPCWAFRFASQSLRSDEEVVCAAIKLRPTALNHASEDLQRNKDLVLLAVRSWLETEVTEVSRAHWACHEAELIFTAGGAAPDLPHSLDLLWEPRFHDVKTSLLAVKGEDAPIISVRLSRPKSAKGKVISCEALLLSGASFSFEMKRYPLQSRWFSKRRWGPTVNDLAKMLLEALRTRSELGDPVKSAKRVFINFPSADDEGDGSDAVAVTPWDYDRPLDDFLLPDRAEVAGASSSKTNITVATCDHAKLDRESAGEGEKSPISAPPRLPHRCVWRCLVPSFG